ncbi:MAG: PspC domain-containing protein, partial [Owenweeksia sp.]
MNKTLNINLGGLIFHIDEDAYHILERYLTTLKRQFSTAEGGEEIIRDIEVRIAELFRERTTKAKEVISSADVEEVISIMGKPEDYLDSEEDGASGRSFEDTYYTPKKRIFRDPDDRILGGVASGLAAYFNIDPLWMRLL